MEDALLYRLDAIVWLSLDFYALKLRALADERLKPL